MQLAVVVPAYNSEQWIGDTLGAMVRSLRQAVAAWRTAAREELCWQVIVVDDASSDGTREAALELGKTDSVEVVSLTHNAGQLGATRHGVGLARSRGAQWIATLDDDVLVGPGFFEELVGELVPGTVRYVRWSSSSRWRRAVSGSVRRLARPFAPVASASAIRMFDAELFDPEDPSIDVNLRRGALSCASTNAPITQHPGSVSRFTPTSLVAHFRAIARSTFGT